jgi:hypothetical protein
VPTGSGCIEDPTHPELLYCPSTVDGQRASYVTPAAAQIGNFGSAIRVQTLNGGGLRLFTTVRGDPSVTWLDYTPGGDSLACGGEGDFPRCDEGHRMSVFRDDESLPDLDKEPFTIAIDDLREHAVVTHLTTGDLSLVRAPRDPAQAPRLEDKLTGLWALNSQNLISAVGAAPRLPGDPSDLFYVTSRSEARINVVRAVDTVGADGEKSARLVRADSFFYAPSPAGNGIDGAARGITFSKDGGRAYVANRLPSSLMIFDTSLDERSVPRNQLLNEVPLCPHLFVTQVLTGGPDAIAVDERMLEPTRAYVSCFDIGEIWVVDAERGLLEARIPVGRGPDSVVIDHTHDLAYVGNYGDDTISVIDLDASHPTYHHTVLQLGKLRGED